jgi:hypothetical protein
MARIAVIGIEISNPILAPNKSKVLFMTRFESLSRGSSVTPSTGIVFMNSIDKPWCKERKHVGMILKSI